MNINATLYGEFIILFALTMGALCYYLGRRKTQSPGWVGGFGALLSVIPPLGLVYLLALVLKKDVASAAD